MIDIVSRPRPLTLQRVVNKKACHWLHSATRCRLHGTSTTAFHAQRSCRGLSFYDRCDFQSMQCATLLSFNGMHQISAHQPSSLSSAFGSTLNGRIRSLHIHYSPFLTSHLTSVSSHRLYVCGTLCLLTFRLTRH